ncbi:hypothetical protein DFH09DRAFT_1049034 [Mycena vulgaris]|nr:hypothetical protein DFH09DRAFT_1049034 [Mycena vulgaris]
MQLGQFSAWVSVEGAQLSEFATEYSADGKKATCWIPSENDKQFCITFENAQPVPGFIVSGRVRADGVSCGGTKLRLASARHVSTASRDSVSTSATTRRPLVFGKQVLTDDDAYLNVAISSEIGSIRVKLRHVKDKPLRKGWKDKNFNAPILHEQSKKAMGHSVQFGAEFSSNKKRLVPEEVIEKLVTFVFKYRPIDLLRAQGTAPPETRKRRVTSDIVDLTIDDDETDEAAKIEKSEARLGVLTRGSKRAKHEPSEIKKEIRRQPIFQAGEVIDLT